MESEIEAIIKEVVDYRQDHCINSVIDIETLVKYVRAQLLIRRGKHVMEVNDLLDLDVLTKIIDKIIGGYPQVKFVSNVPQASIRYRYLEDYKGREPQQSDPCLIAGMPVPI